MPDDASHALAPTGLESERTSPAPRARTAASPVRQVVLFAGGAAVAAAAVALGVSWWTVGRFMLTTNDAYLDADQVVASSKVQGYVTAVLVGDNQDVRAGEPLVRIDPRTLQAGLEQSQAAVAGREADVAAARAQLSRQGAVAAQARAELESARTAAALASRELERYRPLVQSGADTPEKLEQLTSQYDRAHQTVAAEGAAADAAERQIGALKAQIGQAEAQLNGAEAQTRQSRLSLGDTVVTSAIAGRVGDRAVRVGQYVGPGTRLMTIVPVAEVYVTANFKETQLGRMRPGQPVKVRLDALPGRDIEGVVDSFAPGTGARFALLPPENATGNFTKIVQRVPVRIRLAPTADERVRLLPGLSATVKVDTRGAP